MNLDFTLEVLERIVKKGSPTGFCKEVISEIEVIANECGYKFEKNAKGNGIITIDGDDNDYCIGIPCHVDTLGAMVRSINSDGTLRISSLGGNMFSTLDGEYCKIKTREGKEFSATILSKSPAVHVFPDAKSLERSEDNMMVRIDEVVYSKDDVEKLGIGTGDFICVDPKFDITESGFVKSRYLDDKAGTACALTLMNIFKTTATKPAHKVKILVSTYEELGHGCSNIPSDVNELVGIDMGCIGLDMNCTEEQVSICVKDSSGPYDFDMTNKLIELSKENKIDYAKDVYPMYGSDVSASLRAGNDIKGALIGPGVSASHGMERTHKKGIENTVKLIHAYVTSK